MVVVKRRTFLGAAATGLGAWLVSGRAGATLLLGMSLEELSQSSDRIVVGRALEANARWTTIGGRRRIVTDTRVRIEDVLAKDAPSDSEILVQTLGGTVGEISALVHGEAMLLLNEPAVLFLVQQEEGHRVRGMAQGHYPVLPDVANVPRLNLSPRAIELRGSGVMAPERLVGQRVEQARTLVREALTR